jgi:ABC-type uncharacterized transport system involved in gliding motility auxiliary subunit
MQTEIQKRSIDSFITYLIVVVIIIVLNIVSANISLKLDLTNEQVFSITPATKNIIKRLTGPMTVKVFFTPGLPAPYNGIERYLKDILMEYKQNSIHNNFRYEFVDMNKNPDEPMEYGISPVQIRVIEKDQLQMKKAYIGMVFLHANMVERIPQINYTEGLEYNITSIIRKMINKIDWLNELKSKISIDLIASSDIPPIMTATSNGYAELKVESKDKNNTDSQDLIGRVTEGFNSLDAKMMGKLEFHYYDPVKDKGAEALAHKNNFHSISWKSFSDEQGNFYPAGSGYIGLVVEYNGNSVPLALLSEDIMGNPFIRNLDGLEESMQSAVDTLIRVDPKVGYVIGDMEPEPWDYSKMGGQENPESTSRLADYIDRDYEFVPVSPKDSKIPADIQALIIAEPKVKMTPYELYQIDQFIMSGKAVAFFTPGLFFPPQDSQMNGEIPKGYIPRSQIEELIANYGIRINNNLILDHGSYYKASLDNGSQIPIEYAPIILQENISQNHIITKKIKGMILVKSSSLDPIEDVIKNDKLIYTPLIKTTRESWEKGEGVTLDYRFLTPEIDTKFSQYAVAAVLEGNFKSYYDGKALPPEPAPSQTNRVKTHKPGVITQEKSDMRKDFIPSAGKGRIIVFADSDLLKNTILDDEGISPNDIFVKNVVDWLVGDHELMQIRNKGLTYNPLKKTTDFVKNVIRISNLIIAPVLVIIMGLILLKLDIERRKRIKKNFL